MTILQVNKFHYLRGGAERYYFTVSKLLEQHGHTVVHFSMTDPRNAPSPWSKYFVSPLDVSTVHGGWAGLKKAARIVYSRESRRKLDALIRETKPDLAHLHNFHHHLSPSILSVLQRHHIPTVMTLHDYKMISPHYDMLCRGKICEHRSFATAIAHRSVKDSFAASAVCVAERMVERFFRFDRAIHRFIAPSQFMKDKMIAHGLSAARIDVLPYTIDHAAFLPQPPADDPYFLFLGRLSKEKGIDVLLRAMRELPQDVKLKIVGEGPMLQSSKFKVQSSKLMNVDFLGFQEGEELQNLIAKSFAVVVPSVWYENSPNVIYEAFVFGKPVVATRIGGIPELVKDNVTGLLFPLGDAQALAAHMKALVAHPDRARAMGNNARKAAERFGYEHHYEELMKVYGKIL